MKRAALNSKNLISFIGRKTVLVTEGDHTFYRSPSFHHMLRMERKRTGRSQKPFLLMLLDLSGLHAGQLNSNACEKIESILASCLRETDIRGWYEDNRIIGVILTEMVSVDESAVKRILQGLQSVIGKTLGAEETKRIKVSFRVFSEEKESSAVYDGLYNVYLQPDLPKPSSSSQPTSFMKKVMDKISGLSPRKLLESSGLRASSIQGFE